MRRSHRILLPLLSLLATAGAAGTVTAQDVTVGGPADHTNAFPFTNYDFQSPNRYQQLYTASSFSQAVFIDAIRFTSTPPSGSPGTIGDGEYLIRFAVTNAPENGLSTDFDANVAGFSESFFSGVLTSTGLRIAGTPYLYDPARGNLLLDVTVLSQVDPLGFSLDGSASVSDGTSRVYHSWPPPFTGPFPVLADERGLITTFETRPAAVVPEPATLLLLATGLAGVAVVARRRRA